jgi:hypothetical protein
MKLSTVSICVCLCTLFVASAVMADPGPPDPISIDRQSPSVVDFIETPGNIYDMLLPGDPRFGLGWDTGAVAAGMVVHEPDVNYGLIPMQDNNDGHSNGEIDPFESPLLIYFSGDDMSMGMPQTDYDHQAIRIQAAGDRFVTNGFTTVSPAVALASGAQSLISGPIMPGGMGNFPINLLSANQHRYNEIPSIPPAAFNGYISPNGGTQMDDMDALELTPFRTSGQVVIHDTPIFFTLDAMSPSGGGLGADIFVSPPNVPNFVPFAPAPALGLIPNDEVDALAVWDIAGQGAQGGMAVAGQDFALFSLAPGSPSLYAILIGDANYDGVVSAGDYAAVQANFGNTGPIGSVLFGDANRDGVVSAGDYATVQANFGNMGGMSAADIFVTDFSGMYALYLTAMDLGMLPTDNIDAIDVEIWVDEFMFEEQLLDNTGEDGTVPEPATLSLLVIGGLALIKRRRK